MTDTSPTTPDNEQEKHIKQMLNSVNLLKANKYTPSNVVLVTVDDVIEILHDIVPYTMSRTIEPDKQNGAL